MHYKTAAGIQKIANQLRMLRKVAEIPGTPSPRDIAYFERVRNLADKWNRIDAEGKNTRRNVRMKIENDWQDVFTPNYMSPQQLSLLLGRTKPGINWRMTRPLMRALQIHASPFAAKSPAVAKFYNDFGQLKSDLDVHGDLNINSLNRALKNSRPELKSLLSDYYDTEEELEKATDEAQVELVDLAENKNQSGNRTAIG